MTPAPPVSGWADPAFEPVRDAFAENFSGRGEIGGSLCVVVEGSVLVDLCGGWRDTAGLEPWERDTLVNLFSVGKAVSALCVARLVGAGALSFDDAVCTHWPEFAAAGKGSVSVRQLLSHQAGLPAVKETLGAGSIFDWDAMCATLAAQPPWWVPGTAHGYHVNTFGFLVGELVRRVSGQTLGTMVRREVAGPLGADFFIGVPDEELGRVGDLLGHGELPPPDLSGPSEAQVMERAAYFNPPELSGHGVVNTVRWRRAEFPSTNGHGTARGIARIFEALVSGGACDGVRVVDRAALAEATTEQVYGDDAVLHRPSRFGIGFQLTQPERPLGPNASSFGHFGAGGSLGFCDPDAGLAFGYASNSMGPRWQNPRNRALITACYECLG